MSGFFGGGFGSPGSPGGLSGFDLGAAQQGLGQSLAAMSNRYKQLGLSGSTAEAMDLGAAPSLTGGIPAQYQALVGQMQNQALATAPGGSGGKTSSPAGTIGGIGSILGGLK
jgi:hypothetical protein